MIENTSIRDDQRLINKKTGNGEKMIKESTPKVLFGLSKNIALPCRILKM